ncbi:MAG TPA: primosomal protein N' [Nitrospiraceae bacterium]|nr:primosomal protein N' [Nitrospiraceae bacterium]
MGTNQFEPSACAQSEFPPRFAEVVVPRRLHRSFTYSIPASLQSVVRVGTTVTVPFGSTTVGGIIVDLAVHPRILRPPKGWRAILAVGHREADALDPQLLNLARWAAEYYLAPLGQCLPLLLPPRSLRPPQMKFVLALEGGTGPRGQVSLNEVEAEVLARLKRSKRGRTLSMLKRSLPQLTQDTLLSLLNRGLVKAVATDPVNHSMTQAAGETEPGGQLAWQGEAGEPVEASLEPLLRDIQESVIRRCRTPILVEAEGQVRTQVMVAAARMVLEADRRCLFITPEIRRACAIGDTLAAQWGARVALLHSGLSPSARTSTWHRIRNGGADVIVGTRSAVFAPLLNLGLIGVEEEEHPSFKEEQEPHYHAREVAWHRCEQEQAVLLLVSSHASLETEETVRLKGSRWSLQVERSNVSIELVDLARCPYGSVLSGPLLEGMRRTLDAGQRVVLYVNRRGYAPSLTCGACGNAPNCTRCSVPLMFSRLDRLLTCRYCGGRTAAPDRCPVCSGTEFRLIGFGAERLEEEVRRQFPSARILRRDRDEASSRSTGAHSREAMGTRSWDILIGTRLVLHEPAAQDCALLGLPLADAGLHVPDFRAAERTYHSLLDAMALVEGQAGARAILQTFLPHHHVIRAIAERRRALFTNAEMELRKALGYPPFASLIVLQVSGEDEPAVHRAIEQWAALFRKEVGLREEPGSWHAARSWSQARLPIDVLGPVPAPVARLRGQYRWRVLVKTTEGAEARELVRRTLGDLSHMARHRTLKFEVDVDPVDLG